MTDRSQWVRGRGRGRILAVGVAALDIVNEVPAYPAEDAELRALDRRILRGGNAANTLAVLRQLGHACAWAGILGDDAEGDLVLADLAGRGIETGHCVRHPEGRTPTSYVLLSRATGSRTIVHYRDLPELAAADFARVPLDGFDWIHFEGRNPAETKEMLRDCRDRFPSPPPAHASVSLAGALPATGISLEIEKPRPDIESLFRGPDVLIFSRQYARSRGYEDPPRFLADHLEATDARLLVLPWGEDGAYAQPRNGPVCFAPAHSQRQVADTLGAGDVFNAALIHGLLGGLALQALLDGCNALAGHKCSRTGMDDLVASAREAGAL